MRAFIKSSGVISPQLTHSTSHFPKEICQTFSNRLTCIEPDYRTLINPLLLRRMPRILKMGLAASQLCINRAEGIVPEGIIVGTGLGCIDNLEKFLMDVLDNEEHVTSVLPFINSTHNAVAAQVSMMLKNQSYNTTYCHRGFSFESALQDALMLIHEKEAGNVLAGGIDESTNDFVLLHSYLQDWKQPVNNLGLLSEKTPGTIAGEGSGFFMLSNEPSAGSTAICIEGVRTFYSQEIDDVKAIEQEIDLFLQDIRVSRHNVDVVLLGLNGDIRDDRTYYNLMKGIFASQTHLYFKHLCGEYYTASAFALWLACMILQDREIHDVIRVNPGKQPHEFKNVLIYNQIKNTEHSLIYLSYDRI
jgi:3-oxoacyl-[acyl-carrier-protein] synthase II